jgi:hypothetical protein
MSGDYLVPLSPEVRYKLLVGAVGAADAARVPGGKGRLRNRALRQHRFHKQAVHERLVAGIQAQKPDLIFIGNSITENLTRQVKAMRDRHYAARNALNPGVWEQAVEPIMAGVFGVQ